MNDYTPMRGDILTKNGRKFRLLLVTKTRIVYQDHYLGENRGNFWCNRDELIEEVKCSQPKLERPAEVPA